MAILSEMTDVAVDTSHGNELGTLRHEHYDAPQGYEAKWITNEFPNPAALVERYGQLMELCKRQHPKGEFDVESKKADMERIAAVIYGERWDVYQETLREAEAAKANATPPLRRLERGQRPKPLKSPRRRLRRPAPRPPKRRRKAAKG